METGGSAIRLVILRLTTENFDGIYTVFYLKQTGLMTISSFMRRVGRSVSSAMPRTA